MRRFLTTMSGATLAYFKTFTIEPNIIMYTMGNALIRATHIMTDLQIRKVCTGQLGFNETICDNLAEHKEIKANGEEERMQ